MSCPFCAVPQTRVIKQYKYWTAHIAESQQLLGYTIISLNRHIEYLIDVTDDELLEFRDICEDMQVALDALFKPDWYNYHQYGNLIKHLHFHLIPRYRGTRTFEGRTFADERFGKAPERRWVFEEEPFLAKLATVVRERL